MEDKQFDQHLKSKLEQHQVPYNPEDWAVMSEALDLEFGDIATLEDSLEFDNEVQRKLASHRFPYQNSDWEKLKKRLDFEDALVRKVYVTKALELTLFLLVLLLSFQIYNSHLKTNDDSWKVPTKSSEIAVQLPIFESDPAEEGIMNTPDAEITSNARSDGSGVDQSAIVSSSISTIVSDVFENNTQNLANSPLNNTEGSIQRQSIPTTERDRETNAPTLDKQTKSVALTGEEKSENQNIESLLALDQARSVLASLDYLTSISFANLESSRSLESPQQSISFIRPMKRKSLWLDMSAGADANLHNESVLAILNADSIQGSYGFSFYTGLGFQRGSFEIVTGIGYSLKKDPAVINQIGGDTKSYVKSTVENTRLHFFQVPLNLKYHLKSAGKWHFYIGSGIHFSLLASSNENFSDQRLGPPPTPSFLNVPSQNKSFKEQVQRRGILEGGDFKSNTYLTANILIGLQRNIGERAALFVQPTYQHHIFSSTFGLNEDKINVLSLNLGLKFRLK